ncbi:hypothetical protein E2I00_004823 [Balaenoptera physalus]|uniref:FIIND domain-containing protein n=1 Tax=Balaenoptera physalus TaxID=9770 RepID=A0A643C7E9_BALPH|nr:hypothetical protein E2I00_004823 [Balaenoptera physalus]
MRKRWEIRCGDESVTFMQWKRQTFYPREALASMAGHQLNPAFHLTLSSAYSLNFGESANLGSGPDAKLPISAQKICLMSPAFTADDRSASSEEKDCPSRNLDTSKDSKSGDDSSSESSLESESEFNEIQSHCEHCNAENKHNELVTPRLLSRGQFLLKVDTEGTYQCTETGLIFEVNRKVDIKYCVLSWSKYADLVVKPWVVGGPLFDVKCDPTCLTSIHFPHSLCLGHCDANMMFKVLHVKSTGALLEYTVDHSATHVKWHVSSLSPVGPVIQSEETVFHHGAVILYKAIDHNPSLSFRVYIATNNESFIKDISKSVKHSSKKFMKIDKPPVCQKLLQNGKKYRLISDWVQHDQNPNVSKSGTSGNRRRKMSSSLPDEVVYDKRMKQIDTSDGVKTKTLLTDTQLINLAEKLGKEWVKIAIANLKLKISDIDAILEKKEDVTINKFRMLKKWQEKEQSNATAQNLWNCLKNVNSVEVQDVLKDSDVEQK